jgi:regulator of sigma E protease
MEIFIKIVQLLLSLSILVIFHELGHFATAKWFKTRVDKFYIFFNPWFSIFKFKYGETEYGLGWLPLGGYNKIAGMIDESMDLEQMKQPPQPWEFRSKPAWQRLIIMLGGVTVNILLAIVIYIFLLFIWGEQYLPTSAVKYGISVDSLGYQMGLRDGDRIIAVDHKNVEAFLDIPKNIILNEARTVDVIRDGQPFEVTIPREFIGKLIKMKPGEFISLNSVRFPFVVESVPSGTPANKAGIKVNDRIIGLNDSLLPYFDQFRHAVQQYKDKQVNVMLVRNKDTLRIPVQVTHMGLIGVNTRGPDKFLEFKEKSYSFLTAIPAGFVMAFERAGNYVKSIKVIFSQKNAYESVGGFITIGNIFPSTWDWYAFWSLTAFLSIMLAILNLLPIPALDGGFVMFIIYEMIFRRKPSDKFMEYAQIVGMIIILGLVVFSNGNDIVNLFKK